MKIGDRVNIPSLGHYDGVIFNRRWVKGCRYWRCDVDCGQGVHVSTAESELELVEPVPSEGGLK